MSNEPRILLTNDDGVDATGLWAVADALAGVGDVTVVAPRTDRSGSGRSRSHEFSVEHTDRGHVVDGTPADCVTYGLAGLAADVDVVVSGCNPGPNFGAHLVELSGTVGAARQAAFLDVPGVAVSLYCHPEGTRAFDRDDYGVVEQFVTDLVPAVVSSSDPGFGYLNVNVPDELTAEDPVHLTELTHDCAIKLSDDGDVFTRYDPFYDPLRPDVDRAVTDEVGTDRRAVADGAISVTPLAVETRHGDATKLAERLASYDPIGHR